MPQYAGQRGGCFTEIWERLHVPPPRRNATDAIPKRNTIPIQKKQRQSTGMHVTRLHRCEPGRDEGGSDPGARLDTANGPAFVESATWNTIWARSLTRCARTGYSVRLLTALGKHDVLPVQRELMNRFPTVIYFPRFLQFLIFTKDAQMAALLGFPTVKT